MEKINLNSISYGSFIEADTGWPVFRYVILSDMIFYNYYSRSVSTGEVLNTNVYKLRTEWKH